MLRGERERILKDTLLSAQKVSEEVRANARKEAELIVKDAELLSERLVSQAMMSCIDRGLRQAGELPGRLRVKRRAPMLKAKLEADRFRNVRSPHEIMDPVSLFAIAVRSRENAPSVGVPPRNARLRSDSGPGRRVTSR